MISPRLDSVETKAKQDITAPRLYWHILGTHLLEHRKTPNRQTVTKKQHEPKRLNTNTLSQHLRQKHTVLAPAFGVLTN